MRVPARRDPDHELRRRRATARGVLLSAVGYALGLALIRLSGGPGEEVVGDTTVLQLVAVTVLCCGGLYALAATGHSRWVARWDPRFVYLPLAVSAVLLNLYMAAAPAARSVLVHGWIVAIALAAGHARLWPTLGLTALMVAGYLGVAHATGPGALRQELVRAFAVATASAVAAAASERLYRQRRTARDLARQLEDANRRLADMALRDPLTGVFNRRYLEEFLAHETLRAARAGQTFTVAMLDLDDFKAYNDAQGHLAGDRVLREVAQAMTAALRASDLVARYGGEEFTVVLPNTSPPDAARVLERVRAAVAALALPGREAMPRGCITVSVGAACFPQDGTSVRDLLTRADDALYRAKELGKNQVTFATVPSRDALPVEA